MKTQSKPYNHHDDYAYMMRGLTEPWHMVDMGLEPAEDILEDRNCDWTPVSSIMESKESVQVFVELPGLKLRDVEISVQSRILYVSGQRPIPEGFQRYLFMEGKYGWFCRSFSLMETVDPMRMEASMEDGILRISVPKV